MSALDAQIVFLVPRDLEATTHFYVDGLGLPLALGQGTCRIIRVAPGAFNGFCRRDAAPNPDGVIVTLVTEDVDGWFHRLRARGIAIEKAPATIRRTGSVMGSCVTRTDTSSRSSALTIRRGRVPRCSRFDRRHP